ncbi:hypothetical protein TrRE_jg9971, partial [Triparma retinervis]
MSLHPTTSPPSLPAPLTSSSNLTLSGPNASTPTHDNRPNSRPGKHTKINPVSQVPIHRVQEYQSGQTSGYQLPYDPHRVLDFTKTPRSLEIRRSDNTILRMPDSTMMFQAQEHLHEMLEDIHGDPSGFTSYVTDLRNDMTTTAKTAKVSSPINLNTGSLDDYEMGQAVGKGRFSTVFHCVRKGDGSQCAMKKIKLTLQKNDKSALTKCLKEVGLLRELKHPNIVRYNDCFLKDEVLYIVLEWAGGGDLKGVLTKARRGAGAILEKDIWSYFSQCTEAVRHMHHSRIIHRDIKPSNVLIMSDGRVKLGDLGLGRYLDHESVLAFSQVGTPLYMSPEVLRGEGHEFASDVWSLGCLLYEMAMLKSPFAQKGLTMDKLFQRIIEGTYEAVPVGGVYSTKVGGLVGDMINVEPKRRPNIDTVASAALLARTSSSLIGSMGSMGGVSEGGEEETETEDEDGEEDEEEETETEDDEGEDEEYEEEEEEDNAEERGESDEEGSESENWDLSGGASGYGMSGSYADSLDNNRRGIVGGGGRMESPFSLDSHLSCNVRVGNYLQQGMQQQGMQAPMQAPPPQVNASTTARESVYPEMEPAVSGGSPFVGGLIRSHPHARSMPLLLGRNNNGEGGGGDDYGRIPVPDVGGTECGVERPFLSPVRVTSRKRPVMGGRAVEFSDDDLRLMEDLMLEDNVGGVVE